MLLKYKTCYATHKNDVGKISTPFRIRHKPNAQLMTQRPSKVPIHYRDKLHQIMNINFGTLVAWLSYNAL